MLYNIITAIVALIFSALFSGYEMAFLHCNRLKVALDKKEGKAYAVTMEKFFSREGDFIASLLIGNNITLVIYGIAMATILNPLIARYISPSITLMLVIETVAATLIVLAVAEFLPKALCLLNPNGVLKSLYRVIIFFYYLFYPLTWLTNKISHLLVRSSRRKTSLAGGQESNVFDQTDLLNLSEEVEDAQPQDNEGVSDIEIFQNAVDFQSTKIKECLIPRAEIVAIDISASGEELLRLFIDSGYSRIPVYSQTIDNIVGYVLSKDLLKNDISANRINISEILRPIQHVSMNMDAQALLEVMTNRKENIVAVSDEYGGTEGIVTLEDLIEEIFGEIDDELDNDKLVEKKVAENEYIFSARLEVKDLNRKYDLDLPENDGYETLAGLILYETESFPKEKETLRIGNISLTVLKTSKKRIETVSVKILD